jgi:DNA-binding winged helix-turn-helix (wHTH) protein/tetratricopeptide (TPR) repeat protein
MSHPIHRFGEFRVDPATRELHKGDALLPLPPKVFDCLAYLIEHRDRAVGRDELIAAVWGRTSVSDDVLAQTLLRARRAVGDTGNEQRAIRTIPRFGYRWILAAETADADVTELPRHDEAAAPSFVRSAEAAASVVAEVSESFTPSPQRRRRIAFAIVAIVVLIAASAAGLLIRRDTQKTAAAPAVEDLLLVLPVRVTGATREAAWIRLGAMDYVASRLREDANLKVLPSAQTLVLVGRDDTADAHDAGDLHRLELATHATYIIAPQATYAAGRWRVALDVYHAGGSRRFEGEDANPLEATAQAASRFQASLGMPAGEVRNGDATATELAQRIDAALLSGDVDEARHLADGVTPALRADPAVAVRLGQVAFRLGRLETAAATFAPLAGDAPMLSASVRAQAQMGLGAVAVRRQDFETAAREYAAAIATLDASGESSDPDLLGNAYMGRGVANGARDRFDEALRDLGRARIELERAGDRIGAASVDVNLGLVAANRGRYGDAESAFDRAIATFTRFGVRDNLAASLLGKTGAQLTLLDHDGALASSAQAVELVAHLENPILVERVKASRVRALLAAGHLQAAAHLLDPLLAAAAEADTELRLLHAQLQLERGDAAAAAQTAGALLERAQPASGAISLADIAFVLLDASRRAGRVAGIEAAVAALRAPSREDGNRERAMTLALAEAELAAARGENGAGKNAAGAHFVDALGEADRSGAPAALMRCGVAYVRYLLGHRQLDEASALVGRLSPYADHDYAAARATAALHRALGDQRLADAAQARADALAGERDPNQPW